MVTIVRKPIALLAVLVIAAVLALVSATASPIHADGNPIDVTGKPVQLHAARQDPLNGLITDVPLPLSTLPGPAQQFLNTPLSTGLDQFWNGTAAGAICSALTSNLQGAGSGEFHAYGVTCSLARTGRLFASVQGDKLALSYYLPNNVIETYVTTPITCAPGHGTFFCPTDPKISLTLDLELQAAIDLPGPACGLQLDPSAGVQFHNANLDSQNLTADIAKDAATLWGVVTGGDPIAKAERLINQTVVNQPLPLASQIAALSSGLCNAALGTSGDYLQLSATVDPNQGITFQLLDIPPTPSLFPPTLTLGQSLVTAGNTVEIDGRYFPPAPALVNLTLDPVAQSGAAVSCASVRTLCEFRRAVEAGTQLGTAAVTGQGTFSTTVTIPAGTPPGAYTVGAVSGGAQARINLQVAAAGSGAGTATIVIVSSLGTALTSTETDAPFTLAGNGFAPGSVTIALDSAAALQLGSATVAADGTFRTQLQVSGSQAGQHTLFAVEGGAVQAQDAVTFVLPEVIR